VDTLKLKSNESNDLYMPFEEDLTTFLKGCRRLMIAGMGNTLRRDDAVGIKVVSGLKGKLPEGIELLDCGTTPENFSSRFKRSEPTHILFFDAVEMRREPGSYGFIDEETLATQSVSTHKQSVKMLFRVLREWSPGVKIGLVGIQPKKTEFGTGLSLPVKRGLNSLLAELVRVVGEVD